MVKNNKKIFKWINAITDYLLVIISYFIAGYIRFELMYKVPNLSLAFNAEYLTIVFIFSFILVVVYKILKVYNPKRGSQIAKEIGIVISINSVAYLILVSYLYMLELVYFSRLMWFMYYIFATSLVIIKHTIINAVLRKYRKKGYNIKHVIIVGNGHLAFEFKKSVDEEKQLGFKILGYLSKMEKKDLGTQLGSYEDLDNILSNEDIEEVVIALEPHEGHYMKTIIAACEKNGVRTSIIPFYNDYIPSYPSIDLVGSTKLINIRSIPLDRPLNAFLKRFADLFISIVALVILSPLLLIISIGIKLTSRGPIVFKQERIGLNKKPFYMYKFRSMRISGKENIAWTTDDDSRKTKFGAILRKFSLDELLQFINVIKGDMSIVGPRPEIPHFVEYFKEEIPLYLVRQQVRPGITGWAQVHGLRGDTSIEKRIKYDIWYIENWTWLLDIKVICMTIFGGMMNKEKINVTEEDK